MNTENCFAANRGQLISLCIYAPVLCETRISRLIERHHYSPDFMTYILADNVIMYTAHIRMVYTVQCTYGVYTHACCVHGKGD